MVVKLARLPAATAPAERLVQLNLRPPPARRSLGLATRDPPEMRCIVCGRPGSRHGEAIDVGGDLMVPACDQVHPGGIIPYGPPDPVVRPLPERRRRAYEMPLVVARGIAGSLGQTSKMPGASYGIDAKQCLIGGELVKLPGSVCHGCYALKDFYATYYNALKARWTRQRAIRHPMWTEAMIRLLVEYVRRGGERYFRWHDSGDLQSVEHLMRIVAVSEAIPSVHFWLPTREYAIVSQWLLEGGVVPRNLVIRLSAHWVGRPPEIDDERLQHLPTSTVHEAVKVKIDGRTQVVASTPIAVSDRKRDSIGCRAWTRNNQCGPCRACWSPGVRNVSYAKH